MDNEDENGGHGYMEFGCIGSAIVQVFYADDNEGCEADEKQSIYRGECDDTPNFDYFFWEPMTEIQLVQAWLHPETIKIVDE